jgi:hypothetical protein
VINRYFWEFKENNKELRRLKLVAGN